ncbi:ABC transporter substrate-binding protein [Breoghania sp.]|uniref:ABC transporter substrate-binding protein n=1 Tax=Breoghania sp. TaxID=2065378 RepID=UPI002AA8E100|nr:ABC transporter substrate-binding protein [Breoghania sp.]
MKKLLLAGAALATAFMAAAPLPTQAQAKDSSLVYGSVLPKGLDPHTVYDVTVQQVALNAYDGLFRYEGNPPKLEPWLAESYEASADALTWTVKLKPGVTFHDGSPLNADDVVYSFKRLLGLGQGPSGAFKPVLKAENVTKIDDLTVQFVLDKPYAPFLSALPLVAIVNEDLVKANTSGDDWGSAWLSTHEAGSGAYMIDPATYRPQENIDMTRYADHFMGWDHNKAPLEKLHSQGVSETSTRVLALLHGDIDLTDSYLPTDQVERVEKADGVHVEKNQSMRIMLIRMNNTKPPFDNKNFRKCLSHAFNYDGFITVMLKNLAIRNAGPIPNNLWGAPADLEPYAFDMAQAKAECDAAKAEGAPIDRKIEIGIMSEYTQSTQAAQILQSGMRKLGLNLEIVPSTWAQLTTQAQQASTTPDMWVHWVSTYFVDPENWIGQMYDSQFHGTWKASSWYQNDKVDELLRAARAETDQAKRATLYEEADRIIVDDAADIWIYNTVDLSGISDRVKGYKFSPVGSGIEMRWVSVD